MISIVECRPKTALDLTEELVIVEAKMLVQIHTSKSAWDRRTVIRQSLKAMAVTLGDARTAWDVARILIMKQECARDDQINEQPHDIKQKHRILELRAVLYAIQMAGETVVHIEQPPAPPVKMTFGDTFMGDPPTRTCPDCNGKSGRCVMTMGTFHGGPMQTWMTCERCGGGGRVVAT